MFKRLVEAALFECVDFGDGDAASEAYSTSHPMGGAGDHEARRQRRPRDRPNRAAGRPSISGSTGSVPGSPTESATLSASYLGMSGRHPPGLGMGMGSPGGPFGTHDLKNGETGRFRPAPGLPKKAGHYLWAASERRGAALARAAGRSFPKRQPSMLGLTHHMVGLRA